MTTSSLPLHMKAAQFSSTAGGLEKNLKLNTAAELPPSARSLPLRGDIVLVHVLAAALNPVDYKIAELPVLGRLAIFGRPATPGLDFAGTVVAVGPRPSAPAAQPESEQGHDDLRPGQLVFGALQGPQRFGTLADYVVVPRNWTAALPEGIKVEDAASVGVAGLTAYQSIVPNVKEGNRVFINGGSGGTGVFGIQIAKAMGCYVVTSCSGTNAELCKGLGADEVIDYRSSDVVEALTRSARPFDLVVDNVGSSASLYWKCPHFMTPQGKFVQVGAPSNLAGVIDTFKKMLWRSFLGGGKRKFHLLGARADAAQLAQMGTWMQQGKLKSVIDQVFALEDASKGIEKLKTNRTRGKIVIKVNDEAS